MLLWHTISNHRITVLLQLIPSLLPTVFHFDVANDVANLVGYKLSLIVWKFRKFILEKLSRASSKEKQDANYSTGRICA